MFTVEVRDHIMIAHSLKGAVFGPAQKMHGATFVVDLTFFRDTLTEHNFVVDMGAAHDVLKAVLTPLNFGNLDEIFPGEITTTEFLCHHIFTRVAKRRSELGAGADGLTRLRVTLHESHVARASYEADL
ncbi:6-carboxytetrahydropterin synthase [Paroceanicella profunda]|uniref:6-carboxy-5,6,7,8-tetrahydropterin synthase n=1 Tax=Paroceanicella profunda TaxID=2579971 RepID=A0A5B8FIF8_9RHOB|nr:6-carboxytetrahydropterin synthase [Paroceanicella profunda]QDL93028.1 6-carboxytetrahydropterin synthase [Paroceanicella profunda]